MVPDNLRTALLAVALGSLVVLSGIGPGAAAATQQPADVVQTDETQSAPADAADDKSDNASAPTGAEVVETFRNRMSSLETVVMTIERNVTVNGNRSMTTEQRLWVDYEHGRMRSETETNRTSKITVRNESMTVTYDAENNQVSRFNNTGSAGPRTTIDRMLNNSDLTYEGRERLDGEQTYRLSVTPTNTDGMSGSQSVDATIWLDTETYFPEKVHVVTDGEDFEYEMTAQFRNVSLNTSIPDDRFTIDVPEDAEESDYSMPEWTSYDSLSALREAANRTVPSPSVPDAYSFKEGTIVSGEDFHSISLSYTTDDGDRLHVSKRGPLTYDFEESSRHEEVSIGNHTGYYAEYEYEGNTTSVVVLPCENSSYTIYGDLSKAESIDVAESLACE